MIYKENVFAKCTDEETMKRIKCFSSINELWETSVKEFPNDLALADPTRNITYGELDNEVAKFRAVLADKGLKKGDFVGVYAPNTIEWVKAFLAIETLGMAAVLLHDPLQTRYRGNRRYPRN